jgi:hypothetical protein
MDSGIAALATTVWVFSLPRRNPMFTSGGIGNGWALTSGYAGGEAVADYVAGKRAPRPENRLLVHEQPIRYTYGMKKILPKKGRSYD